MFLVRSREVFEHKRAHSSHTQHIPLRYQYGPTYLSPKLHAIRGYVVSPLLALMTTLSGVIPRVVPE